MWEMLQQMGLTSTATGDDTPLSAEFLTATPGQFYADILKRVFFKCETSLLSHRSRLLKNYIRFKGYLSKNDKRFTSLRLCKES
jgi:hypothetical protein